MLASAAGVAPGAPLLTAGGWKAGAPAVGETPALGAPLGLGAPPATGWTAVASIYPTSIRNPQPLQQSPSRQREEDEGEWKAKVTTRVQVRSIVEAYHRVVLAPQAGRRHVVVGQLRLREASTILELVRVAHGADHRWSMYHEVRIRRLLKAVDLLILLQFFALPAFHPYPVQYNSLPTVRAYALKL
ncbi:hypothetical protein C2845_PM07G15280 [Panicum miliaceum]|uniref:Uncharacterized protein n=1 Tax=Panicum miliaceum TaxID=4540 RepID=A0A3L6SRD3_PANMI|nr:hypothetical protein C2845_PM07G15280 [Panicum miliaceum]